VVGDTNVFYSIPILSTLEPSIGGIDTNSEYFLYWHAHYQ